MSSSIFRSIAKSSSQNFFISLVLIFFLFGVNFPTRGLAKYPVEASDHKTQDATSGLVSYLTQLFDQKVVDSSELSRFLDRLEQGKIINPVFHVRTEGGLFFSSPSDEIHYFGVEEYLNEAELDLPRVKMGVRNLLKLEAENLESRQEVQAETIDVLQRMRFHRIVPGTFEMGEKKKAHPVSISQGFEIMSTPMTQYQWTQLMGSNPSYFKEGPSTIQVSVQGRPQKMQPEHPVEQITWRQSQSMIKKINQLAQNDDPILKKVIVDHQKGYRYRLPTDAEWEFVAKNRGRTRTPYFFGSEERLAAKYIWSAENSHDKTHPVGKKLPLIVDGQEFFDFFGNVWIWTIDSKTGRHVMRGGSWLNGLKRCSVNSRFMDDGDVSMTTVGIRLVRTLD